MARFTDICSMRILLIAATRAELAPTLHWLKDHEYQAGGHLIIAGTTGIGCLMSGWWLGRHLAEIHPQLVVQAGIGGSIDPVWNSRQPVVVEKDCLADLGAWEAGKFKTIFDLQLSYENQPPFYEGWLLNPHHRLLEATQLPKATAATVNEISTEQRDIDRMQGAGIHIESMEGAALHFACLQCGIPFLQIRTVSNQVGVRDKSKWEIANAIESLNSYLQHWLPTIKSEWL
ncbi:MAG: futalosine hydrolase [Chitinophagaceae bacterium]